MKRADKLYEQYLELGTLKAVGDAQEPPISRERVRQILVAGGYTQRNSHKIYTEEELKQRSKEGQRRRYRANPEIFAQRAKKWRMKNPEKIKEISHRRYLKVGKEESTRRAREYRANNRESFNATRREYYAKNRERLNAYQREWQRKKKAENAR